MNNDEIYEIVTGKNLSEWDNEIYVSHATESSMDVAIGGIDYVIGATGSQDTSNFKLADIISAGTDTTIVNLSNLSSAEGDKLVATDTSTHTDATAIEAALAQGISDGKSQVSFDYSAGEVTVSYDNVDGTIYD